MAITPQNSINPTFQIEMEMGRRSLGTANNNTFNSVLWAAKKENAKKEKLKQHDQDYKQVEL